MVSCQGQSRSGRNFEKPWNSLLLLTQCVAYDNMPDRSGSPVSHIFSGPDLPCQPASDSIPNPDLVSRVPMPLIKRYPNRKLYDLEAKKYVTLDEIALIVREGQDVQVVDHESGDDLTNLTLSQIIFEQEKKKTGFLPRSILTSLIRTGGDTLDYLRRTLQSGVQTELHGDKESTTKNQNEDLTTRLQTLVANGRLTEDEAAELRSELGEPSPFGSDDLGLMALLDEQLAGVLHRLNIPTYNELQSLQEQLSELTDKLETVLEEPGQNPPSTKSGKSGKPGKSTKE